MLHIFFLQMEFLKLKSFLDEWFLLRAVIQFLWHASYVYKLFLITENSSEFLTPII